MARQWTEALLFAIRRDFARPPVHARNIYHLAAAMYDVWAVHDPRARPLFLGTDAHPACSAAPAELAPRPDGPGVAARERAIGQAAWRLLRHRFRNAAEAAPIRARLDALADAAGLDPSARPADGAERLGARVAACLIGAGRRDDSNEDDDYRNLAYASVNPPLDPTRRGNDAVAFPSRWQPLAIRSFRDQGGRQGEPDEFLGADWGSVEPFALDPADATTVVRDGLPMTVHHDPGPPPTLESDAEAYLANFALVARWSGHLDPDDPRTIDIRPRGRAGGLGPDDLATDPLEQLAHYAPDGGQTTPIESVLEDGEFAPVRVPLGDYARVIAEYWADGIDSETPPGHWLDLYNEHVSAHPALERRLGGTGEALDPLSFDVVAYLALGGALHDAAVAAWSIKGAYDYVRPISAIRYLARPRALEPGEDEPSDVVPVASLPSAPGRIERVELGGPLAGPGGINTGQTMIRAWRGPRAVRDPDTDVAGVGWILARDWWPYQRPSFVTPPFAGYVSGHSTFSRAAAVVLERLTGSPRWPGGSAGFTARANEFLAFEAGPSVDVPLVWATYRDAADQTSLSRIWGGIHPPADDLPARRIGAAVGEAAWRRAAALAGIAPDPADAVSPDARPAASFDAWIASRSRETTRRADPALADPAPVDPSPASAEGPLAPGPSGVARGCSTSGPGGGTDAVALLVAPLGALVLRRRAPFARAGSPRRGP